MWNFGFQLLREMQKADQGKNVLLSPFSIAAVFSMLFEGARGKTRDELLSFFDYSEDAFGGLTKHVETFCNSPMIELLCANTLWAAKDVDICRDYEEKLYQCKRNQLFWEDFSLPKRLVKKVNAVIASQTKNMIQNLIPASAIKSLTKLLLVNALYFEAKWETPFDPEETEKSDFHLAGGKVKIVPFMKDVRFIPYFQDKLHGVHGIFLPYENPDFEFAAIMASGTKKFSDKTLSLFHDNLCEWRKSASSEQMTDILLPKLDISYCDYAMADVLRRLKLKTIFSNEADLTGISENGNLQLEQVIHAVRMKLDEHSTQAAAATVGLCDVGCLPGALKTNQFIADHPFVVVLWHHPSSTPLFVGMINDPQQEK